MRDSYKHLRPTKHEVPKCLVRCYLCGACLDLNRKDKPANVVTMFMEEHQACVAIMAPAAICVVDKCSGIGLGPMQRCASHGGKRSLKEMRN